MQLVHLVYCIIHGALMTSTEQDSRGVDRKGHCSIGVDRSRLERQTDRQREQKTKAKVKASCQFGVVLHFDVQLLYPVRAAC